MQTLLNVVIRKTLVSIDLISPMSPLLQHPQIYFDGYFGRVGTTDFTVDVYFPATMSTFSLGRVTYGRSTDHLSP